MTLRSIYLIQQPYKNIMPQLTIYVTNKEALTLLRFTCCKAPMKLAGSGKSTIERYNARVKHETASPYFLSALQTVKFLTHHSLAF